MVKRRQAAAVAGSLLAATAFFSIPTTSHANVVVGNWTNSTNDGWFYWADSSDNGGNPGAEGNTYLTDQTTTEHSNSYNLFAYQSDGVEPGPSLLYQPAGPNALNGGYSQGYGVKLEYQGDMTAFWNNQAVQVTMTYPAADLSGSTSGYAQVYQFFINAPGWGFTNVGAEPVAGSQVYYYSGASQRTVTFDVNYTSVLAAMEAKGYNATTNQGYAEIILATNSGSGAAGSVYLDQVSLVTVPEPASLSMLGLAAAGLMGRRRRLRR